jgi:CelD/BcsL family acetyltransferase involved in cellulose biosynthesis
LRIKTIDSIEDFALLEQYWNCLLKESGSDVLFLTFEWLDTYWRYFGRQNEPFILVLENGKGVVGLAPMVLRKRGPVRSVEFLGGSHSDYQDFILLPEVREEGLKILIEELDPSGKGWDVVNLRNIRQDSPNYQLLKKIYSTGGDGKVLKKHDVSPCFEIRDSWQEYLRSLNKKMLKDTERQIRRLENLGSLRFEAVEVPDEVDRLLVYYHRQKRSRDYADHVAVDSFGTMEGRGFLRELSRKTCKNGWLDLSYLKLDGVEEPLAISISFLYNGRFYYWLPSINGKYLRYSPGRILLFYLLQESFERNFECFDFLCGPESYKYRWLAEDKRLYRYSHYDCGLRGNLARVWNERLRPGLRENSSLRHLVRKTRRMLHNANGR